ncbi:BCAM0308 family protein, partial [Burkholderia pseudomallei]
HAAAGALLQIVCPACRRIRERASAGELVLEGGYFARRRDDIVALLRRHAGDDINARPLGRILSIDALPARMVVRTKGSPLVHRLTEALVRTHRGDLEIDYREGEDTLRAHWMRDAA